MDMLQAAQDTIVAQATAAGPGGVAIVRVSGPLAWPVGRALLPWTTRRPIRERLLELGLVVDPRTGEAVDQALAAFFLGPRSYTTEDTVELHCHGGPAVCARVIQLALAQGCRLAGPGEFTLRAMLGGRLDLAQAEAVAGLVAARSDVESRLALAALDGGLSRELAPLRAALLDAAASVEAAIDFPDDAPELAGPAQAALLDRRLIAPLGQMLRHSLARAAYLDGASVVICGRPNVGKSSLFNALLGRRRALVSQRPGTTRDGLDEVLVLGGVACRLADTAGLGAAQDELDDSAQRAALERLAGCDLALLLLDGSQPLTDRDRRLLADTAPANRLVAANKCDLPAAWPDDDPALGGAALLRLSARQRLGLDDLAQAVAAALTHGSPEPRPGEVVAGARQRQALERCASAAGRAVAELAGPEPRPELVSLDLALALQALGEVDGQGAPDEVIDAVFANFCVGK